MKSLARLALLLPLAGCAANAPAAGGRRAPVDPALRLITAAARGETETVKSLLDRGTDVNAKSQNGTTALHAAAYEGRAACVDLLLSRGADANAHDQYGGTPLHNAAASGHTAVVSALLAHGADANSKNDVGDTPLVTAIITRHEEAAEALRKAGGRGEAPSGLLGLQIGQNGGRFIVSGAVPGSPAEEAGIVKGDEVVSVNDEPLSGLDMAAAIGKLRGPRGTKVKLTLRRQGGDVSDLTLTRAAVSPAKGSSSEATPWWRTKE